ncbi:cell wall-binding repeat-containing protein [Phycicoccus sp. SLBN-51]|uniref:cell wall-binding repeat-containing protein n=1 Tax=Phycicoccus sp. SLBN-51 TaxID=2768447 RepID=UPI00115100C5|nr:cell wall-binding repeat-containing protein [Phycicoccus sp. SLBN-51]TQJ49854.1 putative cell wall binding repeat protein [Phycicoccus sp. SLBN-51]
MHQKQAVAAAATTAIALLASGAGAAVAGTTPLSGTGTTRIAGANRFETAVKVSQRSFTSPQDVVYIASGESFPDALAAGPAAARDGAPILLVQRDAVPAVVQTELERLKPSTIIVVGGDGAISSTTFNTLATYAQKWQTYRAYGSNRYETAESLAQGWQTGEAGTVYLASGESFADALGGGAAAAARKGALLLTAKDTLPPATKRALQHLAPKAVVVLGGTGAISQKVADDVQAATNATVQRQGGTDRYDTAAKVAGGVWGATGARKVFLASGTSFPDALAATPAAAINNGPILLTRGTCTPKVTQSTRTVLKPALTVYLGGPTITYGGTTVC